MSLPRFCRVPLACSLALALVSLGAQAKESADAHVSVPLCGAEAKTSEYQDLALYATGAGLALGELSIDQMVDALTGAKSVTSGCAKATAANLAIAFPGQAAALLSGPVSLGSAGTNIGVMDPVLCESYATSGLTINLTDTNGGAAKPLAGWQSIRYDLGTRRFVPVAGTGAIGPLVQCHAFPWSQTVSNPPEYGAAGNGDRIFISSFDRFGDLLVEMIDPVTGNRIGELEVTEGTSFSYTMRVSNIGESTVSGVRIREFIPTQTLEPLVQTVSWSCLRENQATCGSGTSAGIALNGLSIAPGQSYTFAIERSFATPAPAGSLSLVAAAAFVDPNHATGGGEKSPADNAQALVLSVVANQAPVVSCTPASKTFQEDAAAEVVTCTATDADGDAINSALAVTNSVGGSSTNFGPVDVAVGPGSTADSWLLTIQPKAEQSGSVTIHAKATDEFTATGAPFAIPVTVNAANDAPSFATHSQTVVLSPTGLSPTNQAGGSLDDGSVHLVSRGSDCGNTSSDGCTISITSFFSSIDAGAANESGQAVEANSFACVSQSGTSVTDAFYTRPSAGAVAAQAADISWIYSKSAAADTVITCDVTFSDNGTPVATSGATTITFSMASPP